MEKSLIVAIIGALLPSFYISASIFLFGTISAFFGIGWIYSGNYFGIYALVPRIFFAPNDWNAFSGSASADKTTYILKSFFSDFLTSGQTSNLSAYGILFTLSILVTIIGIQVLIKNTQYGGILLIVAGALALLALVLYYNALNGVAGIKPGLPIPIGSVVLIIAGAIGMFDVRKTGRSHR